MESAQAPICAWPCAQRMARATSAAEPHRCQQRETDLPHKEGNNLATIDRMKLKKLELV